MANDKKKDCSDASQPDETCKTCERKYDEKCHKVKSEGTLVCKRRRSVKTVITYEVKCEKPVTTTTHWEYKKDHTKECKAPWADYTTPDDAPKHCKKCKNADCKC